MDWIVTEEPIKEAWSRLLEFANGEIAERVITSRHGPALTPSARSSHKKQAQQIRACLLQAHDYFAAAKASSLITSPNHAYYGMVSLASACMLILGDGSKSLDALRKVPSSRSHGLGFSTGSTASSAREGLGLLEDSRVEVLPSGHFGKWYECLPQTFPAYGLLTRHYSNANVKRFEAVGISRCAPIQQLIGVKDQILALMKFLPDLRDDLMRYGVDVAASRTNHDITQDFTKADVHETQVWSFHDPGSPARFSQILEEFKVKLPNWDIFELMTNEAGHGGIVTVTSQPMKFPIPFKFPSSRIAMSFETFSYAGEINTHEFVDMYRLSFGLSMLSRYFPDLWVSCLESNCLAAKLIERFASVLVRKAPMLALSFMTGRDCFLTQHRRPWSS